MTTPENALEDFREWVDMIRRIDKSEMRAPGRDAPPKDHLELVYPYVYSMTYDVARGAFITGVLLGIGLGALVGCAFLGLALLL